MLHLGDKVKGKSIFFSTGTICLVGNWPTAPLVQRRSGESCNTRLYGRGVTPPCAQNEEHPWGSALIRAPPRDRRDTRGQNYRNWLMGRWGPRRLLICEAEMRCVRAHSTTWAGGLQPIPNSSSGRSSPALLHQPNSQRVLPSIKTSMSFMSTRNKPRGREEGRAPGLSPADAFPSCCTQTPPRAHPAI